MTINLHKDLASSGWHSSIITTYSVDPAFYDTYIERRLRTNGVKNNILIADARMLKMALNALPEAFTSAGIRYAVVPVSVAGAFHPKVHLRLGEYKARLVIGSANATAAGWGKNQEVITRLDWNINSKSDNVAMGPLVAKAYAYLTSWLEKSPGEAIRYKLQMMERQSPWLDDLTPSESPATLSDGTAVDLLCESGGDSPSMLKQFSELAAQDKVLRLVVVSPYWDTDLRGFYDLRKALGNPATMVVLNPLNKTFPINAVRSNDSLEFVTIDETPSDKFLHAKIFIVQTNKADHVLFGSANCSDDALGHLAGVSRNAEVSVYRRLFPGYALESLGIDLSKIVNRSEILPPIPIPNSVALKKSPAPAGVIELRNQTLTWWPPHSISATNAKIELAGVSLRPREETSGKWTAEFTAKPTLPLIARVRYHDGLLSDPVIVHSETPLRKAAPGQIDPRLVDALNKAWGPEGDLIELAAQAHIIFEPVPLMSVGKGHGGHSGKDKNKTRKVVEYENEEKFRNAMMYPGTGKTGRMNEDDPVLQDLLAFISHDISGSIPQNDIEIDKLDEDIMAGDDEDNVDDLQNNESNEDKKIQNIPTYENILPSSDVRKDAKFFTAAEVLQRRKQLIKALDQFDTMLDSLKKDSSLISSRLAVQTMFVLKLMRYGYAHPHNLADGRTQKLMIMSEGGLGSERRHSFVFRAAWTLKKIWTGDISIASQIRLDQRQSKLPDDIYGFIVVSRWAITRAFLESRNADTKVPNEKPNKLTLSLVRLVKEIYTATTAIGKVDPIEEKKTISELDSDIGCTTVQT